ncbi:M1 family metallopeptidase [Pedobacter sp.]|uniref:M1 family metallopeptidase n=1 Tax=Pedobacter sp. TaxID=1411316 RepID=UPI003D7FB312
MKKIFTFFVFLGSSMGIANAQNIKNNPESNHGNKFEQLGTILTTPNEQRTASGAPGVKYWQQRADYDIKCTLDEKNLKLTGSETVTYINNSPDVLTYVWLQLDENQHNNINNANYQSSSTLPERATTAMLDKAQQSTADNGYGVKITKLTDAQGKALKYTINKTMMRVEIPAPLKSGQTFVFKVDWNYNIADRMTIGGRGGYEFFPEDGNHIFTMAQWYPRLCVYSDFQGWQNHQFTGRGEFALTFGNFKVQMTVPADHMVASTGECVNYDKVLTAGQLDRYNKSKSATEPIEIVTLDEAKKAETKKSIATKTWVFNANDVRDFAWTSSRKFVWDAMAQPIEGKSVMCMSFYGKEAYGLYRPFSTKAIAHTIKTYSDFTIPYTYPVAQSIEAANGMEYPMICFNYGRTEKDGTYSESSKNGMLGVIIHEVGHNFFPMIINSDERQWTWMDEGLNSFMEYITEELWDNKFPTKKGAAYTIIDYMKLPKDQLEPVMTNSENIVRFGPNAYSKPATALNILRETIMGRELFDYAFKEYATRWAFKHPTPADFFRTMEDASGEDLDWFWRGWFYGTDACDISLDSVKFAKADFNAKLGSRQMTVKVDAPAVNAFEDISKIRNKNDKNISFYTDKDLKTRDFYWRYARGLEKVDTTARKQESKPMVENLPAAEQGKYANKFYYELSFSNKGGLVMPIIVEFTYADGTKKIDRIPAQIWRLNENNASKFYVEDKEVTAIKLDPMRETADIDETNNTWGGSAQPSKFQLFKQKAGGAVRGQSTGLNPMQAAKKS